MVMFCKKNKQINFQTHTPKGFCVGARCPMRRSSKGVLWCLGASNFGAWTRCSIQYSLLTVGGYGLVQLNEEVMERMQETLWTEYGVNVNTSEWNKKVTADWDKAQSLVSAL